LTTRLYDWFAPAAEPRDNATHDDRGIHMNTRSIVTWTLVFGLLWNALGWAVNVFLLGGAWDEAGARLVPDFAPPWSALTHELLSFVSDFVYAFAFVWLFARGSDRSVASSIKLVVLLWLAGAAMTYLAIVNAGFLPWEIAVQSSLLALAIFVVTAPLLPKSLRAR
jgi:hypothetical protein